MAGSTIRRLATYSDPWAKLAESVLEAVLRRQVVTKTPGEFRSQGSPPWQSNYERRASSPLKQPSA